MKSFTSILVMTLVLFAVGSCSKEEKKEEPKPDYPGMLTGRDWIKTAWVITFSSGAPLDRYANLPACEKDDLVEFKTDKSLWNKPGDTKCDPSDPDSQLAGSWYFAAETKLAIVIGDTMTFDVVKLDGAVLQLKRVSTDPVSGITQTEELNLAKK